MHYLPRLRWLQPVALLLPFLAVAVFIGLRYSDADFGWHLRSGQYIWAHGVPSHDIFTYTAQDYRWVNHEWLNDVFLAFLGRSNSYLLVIGVYSLLWTLAYGSAVRWRPQLLVTGLALAALVPYFGPRSIVWSALGLVTVFWLLEQPKRWRFVPLLFALWANLHAGFALGLVALVITAAVRRSWRLALWGGAAVAATFVNPYGWRVYQEIWQTMTDSRLHETISEWAPLSLDQGNLGFLAVTVVVLIMARTQPARRLLGALLLLATLQANRQMPFLVLVMARPLQEAWSAAMNVLRTARPSWTQGFQVAGGVASVGVVAATLLLPAWQHNVGLTLLPNNAIRQLDLQPCAGQLFNEYSYGGYIAWQLPGTKVYIDGRMPSWSGPEGRYLDRWERVMKNPAYAEAEFKRYNVNCVLIERKRPLSEYLQAHHWRATAQDADSILWRRP